MLLDGIGGIEVLGASREAVRMQLLAKQMPATTWQHPLDSPNPFPDLSAARVIGLDIESKDPNLHNLGPGFIRGEAHSIGLAIATDDGWTRYYPYKHENGRNMDPQRVFAWAREQLGRVDQPKVGANLSYDLEGLHFDGVHVAGSIQDVQVAGPLLDENRGSYSLDNLAKEHLGFGKNEDMLRTAARLLGLGTATADVKRNLYKLPPQYAGPYAESDAFLAIQILQKQKVQLEDQGLMRVFEMESKLTPILLKMRLRGVPVDVARAEQVNAQLAAQILERKRKLKLMVGFEVNVWAGDSLRKACEAQGVPFNRTAVFNKNLNDYNASFTKDWLKARTEPWLKEVIAIRNSEKLQRDFVLGVVLNQSLNGRIHAQFHQLRKDKSDGTYGESEGDGQEGTRTGRMSSSKPNLQQIPTRDKAIGPLIRGLFIPEPGCQWFRGDYSGQEPRLTLHYAALPRPAYPNGFPGAAEAVDAYRQNPNMDSHTLTAELTGLTRDEAKIPNLGIPYGMGVKKFAWQMGFISQKESVDPSYHLSAEHKEKVDTMLAKYHAGVPFMRPLMDEVSRVAETRGNIRSILGARCRFDEWEPRRREGYCLPVRGLEAARRHFGDVPLKRSGTYKALNRLIQQSAAYMLKAATIAVDAIGKTPYLLVHDEICSADISRQEESDQITEVMQHAMELMVPIIVGAKTAANWAEAK